jgi:hypothetical protein
MQSCVLVRRRVSAPADVDVFEAATHRALGIQNGAAGPLHSSAYVLFRQRVIRRLRGAGLAAFHTYVSGGLRVACAEAPGDALELRVEALFPELPPPSPPARGKRGRREPELQFELEDVTIGGEDVTPSGAATPRNP